RIMDRGGWSWGRAVLAALGGTAKDSAPDSRGGSLDGFRIWNRMDEWEERPPEPPPGCEPVTADEARDRLRALLGHAAEERPSQADYAAGVAQAFAPRQREGEPCFVLAEAGTGVGKTLGYLAPASVWSEKNKGTVWISTFTRNLQRQLDAEADRLHPDPDEKAKKVVVRKGRENYFCLLNFDEALGRLTASPGDDAVALGLMARWALATRDGDMVGGDFPAWLVGVLGSTLTIDLTDTRGECIYSACTHYKKCFIERTIRRARRAQTVIGNHALVMVQAAANATGAAGPMGEDNTVPVRFVFDEGHHLFNAADGAFSAHLSGWETTDLRRWILGAEGSGRSRSRGLKTRIEDLIANSANGLKALSEVRHAARCLPAPGWRQRLQGESPEGPAEAFFLLVRGQVYAREENPNNGYDLEAHTHPPVPGLEDAAKALETELAALSRPLGDLRKALSRVLEEEGSDLETTQRQRLDAMGRSLERRAIQPVNAWRGMLSSLCAETPPEFVDWLSVERRGGRDFDYGLHRHWIDPTLPFAKTVVEPAHGVLVTSATLRDHSGDEEADWIAAEALTGARHLASPVIRIAEPSPFNYAEQTRVLVVGDVTRTSPGQVSAAFRDLFLAAGGGALGLFTAISRLRAVHERIAGPLEAAGLPLLAQHVDTLDTGTLIDIFRAEENTCLLGTDAVRDGVDVPGNSLRLIVFDRVPWPRPDILHKARREAFGGRAYDEMMTRLKLKQAYGRLIRRETDRGVFVMLDRGLPSRLLGAFPEGIEVVRTGLKDACAITRSFLAGGE
ncbi:MAG: ATP-dependent DNA helicase, partial [Rhodospirillales bacterium]|nr:ATP-dependent DNA helicase [Rhodospirillales bacterium]